MTKKNINWKIVVKKGVYITAYLLVSGALATITNRPEAMGLVPFFVMLQNVIKRKLQWAWL